MLLTAHGLVDELLLVADFSDNGFHTRTVDVVLLFRLSHRQMAYFDDDWRSGEVEFLAQTFLEKFEPVWMQVVFIAMNGDEEGRRRVTDLGDVVNARGLWSVARERLHLLDAPLQDAVNGVVVDVTHALFLNFESHVDEFSGTQVFFSAYENHRSPREEGEELADQFLVLVG